MDNLVKEQIKFKINDIDKNVPTGSKSHQELLDQMASENGIRNEVINEKLYLKLREYATFRHFYRHAYSFQLNWQKMKPLVKDVHTVWQEVKSCLTQFI